MTTTMFQDPGAYSNPFSDSAVVLYEEPIIQDVADNELYAEPIIITSNKVPRYEDLPKENVPNVSKTVELPSIITVPVLKDISPQSWLPRAEASFP